MYETESYPEQFEEVVPGLGMAWCFDKRVVVYKLSQASSHIVDEWTNLVDRVIASWPKERPYLAVHDLSEPGVSMQYSVLVAFDYMNIAITQKGLDRIEPMFIQNPGFEARVAVSFNITLSGQIGNTLMRGTVNFNPQINYKAFYNQDKALEWLAKEL